MMEARAQAVQVTRLVALAMMASVAMYAVVGEVVARERAGEALERTFLTVFGGLAVALAGASLFARQKLVGGAEEGARQGDAAALGRWRAGHFVALALAESVALFGFVVRFMGGSLEEAAAFYGAGLVMMALAWPRSLE